MGNYTFCAAVHYIFSCGEGEPVYNLLRKLELHDEVQFNRLDPEGYDRFRCPTAGLAFDIPNGLDKWADRLIDRFPDYRSAIAQFFKVIHDLVTELRQLPVQIGWRQALALPVHFTTILRYRGWTLQRLFDRLQLPRELQAVLATQIGDIGLPPRDASLIAYAGLIWSYGNGAYHPRRHFAHFIDSIAKIVAEAPGCRVEYQAEVAEFKLENGRLCEARTRDGRTFAGDTFICNMDPQACVKLIGPEHFPRAFRRRVSYDYSVGSYTVYLGIRGLDLRDYGFGNFNVWHYPHLDLNEAYRRQADEGDLSDPWLFMSTPTLQGGDPESNGVCPAGEQILELVTVANYDHFRELKQRDEKQYRLYKRHITRRFLDILEAHYVPGIRRHVAMQVSGTPTTNVDFLWAPRGNIYGSALTPRNVDFTRLKFKTPIENLFFTGASSEFPSIGATAAGGARLYTYLTGDSVNPGRDRYDLW